MIRVSAPGKMIIIGEYAVLEGAPALVCAVDRRAFISVNRKNSSEFLVSSPSLGLEPQPFVINSLGRVRFDPCLDESCEKRFGFFRRIFEAALDYTYAAGAHLPALEIELDTDDFYSKELHSKYGFGSSAALTTALIKAVCISAGINAEPAEIFKASLDIHHKAQGNLGSGIDIAASNFGGILVYERSLDPSSQLKVPRQVQPWPEMQILPIWTGRSASTRRMVSGVGQLREEQPALYKEILERLSEISAAGCQAYQEQQADVFLECAASFYSSLEFLGAKSNMPIISESHANINKLVTECGGKYKPSGAGSGDIGLAFSSDPEITGKIKEKLIEEEIKLLDVKTDTEPVKLEN